MKYEQASFYRKSERERKNRESKWERERARERELERGQPVRPDIDMKSCPKVATAVCTKKQKNSLKSY